jgi:RNA polymerase sigma factor (sigma-70 family)
MHTDVHDVQLLLSLEQGHRAAFWTLWMKHEMRLRAVCLREMKGNRVDAEDALHEAMLHAYDKLPRFAASIASPCAWLIRMTSNVCRNLHRQRARSKRIVECLEVLGRQQDVQPAGVAGGDARSDDYDLGMMVALLPDRLREVFVLRVLESAPYRDIAARLGVTCVTARKRVQQSRELLREWRRRHAA